MLKKWRTLDSKIAFRNDWVRIRQETCETHTGRVIDDYFIYEGYDVVIVVAITTDQQVVLVRQYKHGIREFTTEVVGGGLHIGELPEDGARRELQEETGYTAKSLILLGTNQRNPTNSAVKDYAFLATDAFLVGPTNFDENENIETTLVSVPELRRMLKAGEIKDIGCIAAIYQALDYLKLL